MNPTLSIKDSLLTLLDERIPPAPGSAQVCLNYTVSQNNLGASSEIGYEKYFPGVVKYGPWDNITKIHSLYIWTTHNGAAQYTLFEDQDVGATTCKLRYTLGNPANAYTLQSDRAIPAPNELSTSYVPTDRYLVVMNGHDKPVKFDGVRLTQLGWTEIPSPPRPIGVDTVHAQTEDTEFLGVANTADFLARRFGLGLNEDNAPNLYKWKVLWVYENGSKSPISTPSELVAWATSTDATYGNARHSVILDNVPIGPSGVIAREFYRTKNLETGAGSIYGEPDELYYYVARLNNNIDTIYIDSTPDAALGNLAPTEADSVIFPANGCRFGAWFKGCLFLDGGQANPGLIYHSTPAQLDTFKALAYVSVGNREGGDVTGMFTYYNQILVFRERAIDIIKGDPVQGFYLQPFTQDIGTVATHSVANVPGVGVAFLANNGVWAIRGGSDGGATLSLEKISGTIVETLGRLNLDSMFKATSAYSDMWREFHCYFPADGSDDPSLGIVLHTDKLGWSTRDFPVGRIVSDTKGNLIFAHNSGRLSSSIKEVYEAGLFVITNRRINGYTIVFDGQQYVTQEKAAPTSVYRSRWFDMGTPYKKKVPKYLYLYLVAEGTNGLTVNMYSDNLSNLVTDGPRIIQQPEYPNQPVYSVALWDQSEWQDERYVELRFPLPGKAANRFCFEVSTNKDHVLLGYALEVQSDGVSTLQGQE